MKLAAILALVVVCTAQPIMPTKVGSHQLGETFDEWLAAAGLNLSEICGQRIKKSDRIRLIEIRQFCIPLTRVQATGKGIITDPSARTLSRLTGRALTDKTDQTFTWTFENGRLSMAATSYGTPFSSLDPRKILAQLVEAYGPVFRTKTVANCIESWATMPDGAMIWAKESFEPIGGDVFHIFRVNFFSNEKVASLPAQTKEPNPFLPAPK